MNRNNVSKIILEGVKKFAYATIPSGYPSSTFLIEAFLDWLFEENEFKPRRRYYASGAVKKLIRSKFIVCDESGGFQLSGRGEKYLAKLELRDFEIPKPRKWDGKYRVIIFDIAETKRKTREEVRRWLCRLGFVRLQNSVWVFPYDCQDIIALIKANYGVVKDVIYLTVDTIEDDRWLREEFDLQ